MNRVPKLRFKEFSNEWEEKKLGEIADIYDGTHQTPNYVESGIKFVSVEDIKNINQTQKYISEKDFNNNFKIKPKINDILMTRITAGVIGDTSIVSSDEPLGFYVSLALIRKKENLEVKFLNYYINSYIFKNELHKKIIHVAFPKKINLGDIGKCKIKITNLQEQEKIGNFISNVDKKISITEEKLKLFNEYKKGIMQKIFSQQLRFKDENGNDYPEWKGKKLGEIITNISSGKTLTKLNIGNFNLYGSTGKIGFTNTADYCGENILIARVGANAGTLNFINEECGITDNTLITSVKNNNCNKWLYYYLINYNLNKLIFGSGQPLITGNLLKKICLDVSCLEEQQKIADFLSAIDNKIEKISDELENLKEFKKGLLQQMFV